ncbi:RDD family protein [Candidatus Mycobacterium methanotrophicum]|uniref:RDD family protein n=1 Tax=Candidatus Mycobacterium methanotrophicum TaxID=2943498 RepID=A0ABY4QI76_9MYCO|nr:RDD family protein [Candidatus Mycobacterium methanotrophicum]UQX09519.1 RDD family protein [Candidatus Mycobacterium methanotrophicum]
MARRIVSWLSGPGPLDSGPPQHYPGGRLGLPERGSGSLARLGRRMAALVVDWLLADGLAALGTALGLISPRLLSSAVLLIWLALGVLAVRLFGFTPGQFALGLAVASVDERMQVGLGRAAVRGVLIALVVPALFVDVDGRGLQDRLTATAVVRR